jgi:hypothetical protein
MQFLYYVENVLILSSFLNENAVLILKKLEYEACRKNAERSQPIFE